VEGSFSPGSPVARHFAQLLTAPPRAAGQGGTNRARYRPAGRRYAATGSPTMSRVLDGSTLIPGPIVVANVTERM
jgi:hypothetical protein